ncbi:hypothetical protein [Nocardia goodfellowii]|uniref:Uncharacterized protein n=1 Tax=Nocardia goodfellowii TaxID=882446 RepID=A0ABS4QHD0_9NOCA|nr:hypothetical protein [Nocardia goodfellowii]MBP2190523.1 hypothetical protein [Nocardia goodfellowii]
MPLPPPSLDDLDIQPVDPPADQPVKWDWGWVVIDRRDSKAIGVLTTERIHPVTPDSRRPFAVVRIIHARRGPVGDWLLAHARQDLGRLSPPVTLYRSGIATPGGERVCGVLELDPRQVREIQKGVPLPDYPTDIADQKAREHLEAAAKSAGVEPIPAKQR